ncbi:MAG: OmpA family protein [Myxococcales bacterium]|nr:OmpA family protein [Myxococcales bacterium]
MHRAPALVLVMLGANAAAADPTQVGVFFGPRVFSNDSLLGYNGDKGPDAPPHATLNNTIQFGPRIARPFFPWFVPELEIGLAPSGTDAVHNPMTGTDAAATSVFWIEPRLQVRFELLPGRRIMPFVVVGGGAPISLSSAKQTFGTDILGEGYLGGGVRFDTGKRFTVRADARVALLPGIERYIAVELDFSVGIELRIGARPPRAKEQIPDSVPVDRDMDGIVDAKDRCPTTEEDADGFDDLDGCPDIDNDLDKVLDIADRCANVPETYNGFEDDDGCPDTVPQDVDALRGTIEGLLYGDGETAVRDSAQANLQRIAKIMAAHPSIKVVLIGHTDAEEAKQFVEAPKEGEAPPPDLEQVALDLSKARAESVKQALVALGVAAPRINVDGKGAEEPVAENDKPKGRLANRRVEIKLYVPPR